MTKAPHVQAAFINAIAEEGSKRDAVRFLQEIWDELCEARTRLLKMEGALATARRDALAEFEKVVRGCIYHDSAGTGFNEDKFEDEIRALIDKEPT